MIKTLRVQQWWLYKSTHCFHDAWNPRALFMRRVLWGPRSPVDGPQPLISGATRGFQARIMQELQRRCWWLGQLNLRERTNSQGFSRENQSQTIHVWCSLPPFTIQKSTIHVGKYIIHGSYGNGWKMFGWWQLNIFFISTLNYLGK